MSDLFYNGNKLLSLKTLSGSDPELFFCVGNRTAGKTFFFKRWLLRRFVNFGEKFVIFVRQKNDMPNLVEGFFADVGPLFFKGHTMSQKPIIDGAAAKLFFDNEPCGYVIPLKYVRPIKANSALFSDAVRGFMDEFQDEDGRYLPNEMHNFNNIKTSIARGGASGAHTRYFPIYLCSNTVTIFNPYFDYFHIASRMESKAKYIRGDTWVLEQVYNEHAAEALASTFKSMGKDELDFAAHNKYLLDNNKFVRQLPGQKSPVLNFVHNGDTFGLWMSKGNYYVSSKISNGLPVSISFNIEDHDEGDIMIPQNTNLIKSLRTAYMQNKVFFESQKCKHAYLDVCTLIK